MDDLGFGLGVALAGLGIVFGLLLVLWLLLTVALRLDRRPAPPLAPAARPGDLDPRLAAAIAIAVIRHTDALRRQVWPCRVRPAETHRLANRRLPGQYARIDGAAWSRRASA